jgi:hypothetical protein
MIRETHKLARRASELGDDGTTIYLSAKCRARMSFNVVLERTPGQVPLVESKEPSVATGGA